MNLAKRLKVEPGSKVKLSDIDPDFHGTHESEDEAEGRAAAQPGSHHRIAAKALRRSPSLSADCPPGDRRSRQGWDLLACCRCDGSPGRERRGVQAANGEKSATTIFYGGYIRTRLDSVRWPSLIDRTTRTFLVVRVHDLVPKHVWKQRFEFINNWERLLVEEKNTTILKFFLYISKDEQLSRFKDRLDDPTRQWKISDSDYSERKLWDKYIDAFEAAISKCSTEACAMVHHSRQPQMVQEFRCFADCCSRDGGHESQPAKADS